jgi:hypothetical protein
MRLADDIVTITDNAVAILALLESAKEQRLEIERIEDQISALELSRDFHIGRKRTLEDQARKIYNSRT